MTVVAIRNGEKLCATCRDKGCARTWPAGTDREVDFVSDEPCECCELDVAIDDGFGV